MEFRETGISLLEALKECQQEVGIYEHCFLSFGTLLGAIRPSKRDYDDRTKKPIYKRGIISYDGDMDLGILVDRITSEQREGYFKICKERGLMDNWAEPHKRKMRRQDNKELLWFSTKRHKPGMKCCQWHFFDFKGYVLHSKGRRWLSPRKFSTLLYPRGKEAQGMALASPAKYFKELVEIDFEGIKYNVPLMVGSILDYWYPNWHTPKKGGSSKKNVVVVIYDWRNRNSWRIL